MDTNERLRKAAAVLVKSGVSQKTIASYMGMQTGTFNKWLHGRHDAGPVRVSALDGFRRYIAEQAALFAGLQQEDHSLPQPSPRAAVGRQRKTARAR